MANNKQKSQTKNSNNQAQPSHKVRTFFSAVTGTIAVWLVLSSLTVIWLNRTLTDTNNFVATVGPLVQRPEIQTYVATTVTDQLVDKSPAKDLAKQLLTVKEYRQSSTTDQLKTQLKPIVNRSVLKIVQSPQFAALWTSTLRTAHASFIRQLNNANADTLTLDLSPAISGVVYQMKQTELKPVAKQIEIKPDTGKLNIKSDKIGKIHQYYKLFKQATVGIIILTIVMLVLSVWLSVHHGKTARRILFATGILALLQAAVLQAPSIATIPGNNAAQQAAARIMAESLVHNLQVASIVIGVVCLAAAIGSKLYVKYGHK